MTDIVFYNATPAYITRTPGVAGGKLCVAGRRVRVQDVYVWHEHLGMSADEIASACALSLVQVYAALTYAFEHLEEMGRKAVFEVPFLKGEGFRVRAKPKSGIKTEISTRPSATYTTTKRGAL